MKTIEGHITAEHKAWWASKEGKQFAKLLEPVGPLKGVNESMLYHFHRFVMDGASDDLAIMGWRHVMDTRQSMRVKPKGLTQSK